jgi:hypothetical protein
MDEHVKMFSLRAGTVGDPMELRLTPSKIAAFDSAGEERFWACYDPGNGWLILQPHTREPLHWESTKADAIRTLRKLVGTL